MILSTERKWLAVSAQLLNSNGTSQGLVTVADTSLFRVKKSVILKSLTQPNSENLEVKRIISETQMYVGALGNIDNRANLSAYTTADLATIEAIEQARSAISQDSHSRASYEEEPVMAQRSVLVDKYGNLVDDDSPLPVKVEAITVENLHVQLTHLDNTPNPGDIADSVRIGDGTNELLINPDGSINMTPINALVPEKRDEVLLSYDPVTQDLNKAEFLFESNLMATIDFEYDEFSNLTRVIKS